jgi:general stress protein 26
MDLSRILEFMRSHHLAVQATTTAEGTPQAAVVGFAVTDQCEIVFDTLGSTRKARNLRVEPRMALVIGGLDTGDERTIQFEGLADEPVGEELERLKRVYYAVFPDGPSRLRWPGLTYVRVRPAWIRYSDYKSNPPAIIELGTSALNAALSESLGKSSPAGALEL